MQSHTLRAALPAYLPSFTTTVSPHYKHSLHSGLLQNPNHLFVYFCLLLLAGQPGQAHSDQNSNNYSITAVYLYISIQFSCRHQVKGGPGPSCITSHKTSPVTHTIELFIFFISRSIVCALQGVHLLSHDFRAVMPSSTEMQPSSIYGTVV